VKFRVSRSAQPIKGEIRVPSDKSLSHRSVMFAAMAEGVSRITGVLNSEDVHSTMAAVRALGAEVRVLSEDQSGLTVEVVGWGARGPVPVASVIDCGNSGTTARLICGIIAPWPISVTLSGDESLSRRPMRRVTDPLTMMGAIFQATQDRLPMVVTGGTLKPIEYATPVSSAQVKSAVLLAGLNAKGKTVVIEPAPSRDHTERMLESFGVRVGRDPEKLRAWVEGPVLLRASDLSVPADPSSAAFIVAAALVVPGSKVVIHDVCLNPTRIGFLRVLERMGADIEVNVEDGLQGGEPVGSIVAQFTSRLNPTVVTAEEVPALVDEIPVLALIAATAAGTTRFEGVGELRVKESDRLQAIYDGMVALGVNARASESTLEVDGISDLPGHRAGFASASLDSLGDHRLAMVWAVAGLAAAEHIEIDRFEAVSVSYPGFADDMASLGAW